jgi:histidine kinase
METPHQDRECIFEGAATRVYRAERDDGARIAVKQLREVYPSTDRLARFAREFEITRSAAGEGVIEAHELRIHDGLASIVLEDFGATSLALATSEERLPLADVLWIGVQVAGALARIHRLDVVHKDVNPSNVVWNAEMRVAKLIDFGISQVLSRESLSGRPTQAFEGTPPYMSPEQTGRMNRSVDCRSDLYSLGATLYELVTGRTPFPFSDRLRLVHAHIAKTPPAPHVLDPEVPEPLSRIIGTLLEKRAEDRYQSAAGLRHDLAQCLEQLEGAGRIDSFQLRQRDVEERLRIPQKLYGRDHEVAVLLGAFERAVDGPTQVLLVGGYSGIGKTSFVHEVHRSLVAQRGRFVEGKFDQFNRGTPYASLVQAFRELTRQTLAGAQETIQSWRERVLASVGFNGRVLTEVIPEAEHFIGSQPEVETLSPTEARNRFHLVIAGFVRAMASPEHPLVIFLDDLQWADLPSIELITSLASDPEIHHVLWIGAYRDNEVDPDHPLVHAVAELEGHQAAIETVTLGPLSETDVLQLVGDTVLGAPGHVQLARTCHEKTGGNAFFLNRFLEAAHTAGQLRFDAHAGAWTWDLAKIREQTVTANVVEFMTGQILRLPEAARRALELAACIGGSFDLRTLASLLERTRKETLEALRPALAAELVVPAQDGFWYVEDVDESTTNFAYQFVHDRVRQSAHSQLQDEAATQAHQRIAEFMLEELNEGERAQRLFELVEHLNRGVPPTDQERRDRLCDLNLAAGRRAANSAAFQPAHAYLSAAYEQLGAEGWARRYEVALAIHVEGARAAHLSGDTPTMEARVAAAIEHGRTLLDRVLAQEVKIYALVSQQRFADAVDCALDVLAQLGVDLPHDPSGAEVEAAVGHTLAEANPDRLAEALARPELKDETVIAAMRIQNGIMSSTYLAKPALLPLLACHIVRETIAKGPCAQSAYGFTVFALVLVSGEGIDTAYRIGQVARGMLERWSERSEHPRVLHVLNMMVDPWVEPLRDSIAHERRTIRLAMDTGDLEYANWGLHSTCCNSFYAGVDLRSLGPTTERYLATMERQKQLPARACTAPFAQAIRNLGGEAEDPTRLVGPRFDEETEFEALIAINFRGAILVLHTLGLYLRYLFRDLTSALEVAERGFEFCDGAVGTPNVLWMHQYRVLTFLAVHGECSAEEAAAVHARIDPSVAQMEAWLSFSPVNHEHRVALVHAEIARIEGRRGDATLLYDQAIAAAKRNAFSHEEALGNELAGRFHLARGSAVAARGYLLEACYSYERWGASAKTAQLQEEFAQLLPGLQVGGGLPTEGTKGTSTTRSGEGLDLDTLFKAANAISSEIRLDDLLGKIMDVAIENAGATHGFLFLEEGTLLQVGTAKDAEGNDLVAAGTPLDACEELPASVATYVARTSEQLVVNDAREDSRWRGLAPADRPTSVLSSPLSHQGRCLGIMHLENRLTAGAFTPARIQVLTLLSAQAAISIENAKVYEVLEETVASRTQELAERNARLETTLLRVKEMQAQMVTQEKLASLGALVAGIAHEIKNPLNFVNNFAALSVELSEELRELAAKLGDPADREEVGELATFLLGNASKIVEHGQRADGIVQNMLGHSRGSEGGVREPSDVSSLLDYSIEHVTGALGQPEGQRLSIERDYPANLSASVVAQSLRRVFLNVIDNACYAVLERRRAEGEAFDPLVRVRAREEGDCLEVSVGDNGLGVPEEVRERIFDPFFTTKGPGVGSGLGLSLSHEIVTVLHEGELTVVSEPGDTTFRILIPIRTG